MSECVTMKVIKEPDYIELGVVDLERIIGAAVMKETGRELAMVNVYNARGSLVARVFLKEQK